MLWGHAAAALQETQFSGLHRSISITAYLSIFVRFLFRHQICIHLMLHHADVIIILIMVTIVNIYTEHKEMLLHSIHTGGHHDFQGKSNRCDREEKYR